MDIGRTVQVGRGIGYIQAETAETITLVLIGHGTYTVERGKIIGVEKGKGNKSLPPSLKKELP